MANKKFYWLKLKDDFFNSREVKKLRTIAGGDTFTIIYLKIQLLSIKKEGLIEFEGTEENIAEQLSLELDETVDNIKVTMSYLNANNLIETVSDNEWLLNKVPALVGNETDSAERMRNLRAKTDKSNLKLSAKPIPKSNAERQKKFKAKTSCEKVPHIPYIEDYLNSKRYNDNYYIILKRDKFKCAICGSTDNICVHHIDGYEEFKRENSNENKMLTMCRVCHSNLHGNNLKLEKELLDSIDYYDEDFGNENELSYTDVTPMLDDVTQREEKRDNIKEIEIKEKPPTKDKSFKKPTIEEIKLYISEKGYFVDAERFTNHYDSNGWKVGKVPMKDWKAAVRNWASNDKAKDSSPTNNGTGAMRKW